MNALSHSLFSAWTSTLSPEHARTLYDHVLTLDGGERIFTALGFSVGRRCISPLRADADDKNSFSIYRHQNGHCLFNDFAGTEQGDGRKFYMLLRPNATPQDWIQFMVECYGITFGSDGSFIISEQDRTPITPQEQQSARKGTQQPIQQNQQYTSLYSEVHTDESFTVDELRVLSELSGGYITQELLRTWKIFALRSYTKTVKDEQGRIKIYPEDSCRYSLVVTTHRGNYYGYCYYQAESYSTFHGNKNMHLRKEAYTDEDGILFQLGLYELRPRETAYLCEGIKDFLILASQGYNVFTLGSTQYKLQASVLEVLRDKRCPLAIVFDTDFAGVNAAALLEKQLRTSFSRHGVWASTVTLPKLQQQLSREEPKPLKNDVADYVVLYGFDDDLRLQLAAGAQQIIPDSDAFDTGSTDNNSVRATSGGAWEKGIPLSQTHQLFYNNYLSEDDTVFTNIKDYIMQHQHGVVVLNAPTGSGKTKAVMKIAKELVHENLVDKAVIVLPLTMLTEQVSTRYADDDVSFLRVDGSTSQEDLDKIPESRFICTTYNSLHKIKITKHTFCCVDEYHELSAGVEYREKEVQHVLRMLRQASIGLMISATPDYLLARELDAHILEVRPRSHTPKQLQIIHLQKPEEVALRLCSECYRLCSQGKVIIWHDDHQKLKKYKQLFLQAGIVHEHQVAILSSDNKEGIHKEVWQSITATGTIPDEIRIILCTRTMLMGVSIDNTDIQAMIAIYSNPQYIRPQDLTQFIARPRNGVKELFCIMPDLNGYRDERYNSWQAFMKEKNTVAAQVAALNQLSDTMRLSLGNYFSGIPHRFVHDDFAHRTQFNKETNVFEVNTLYLINKHSHFWGTNEEFCAAMSEYGIDTTVEAVEQTYSEAERENTKVIEERIQEDEKALQEAVLYLLFAQPTLFLRMCYYAPSWNDKTEILQKIQSLLALPPIHHREAATMVRKHGKEYMLRQQLDQDLKLKDTERECILHIQQHFGRVLASKHAHRAVSRLILLCRWGFDLETAATLVRSKVAARSWGELLKKLSLHARKHLLQMHPTALNAKHQQEYQYIEHIARLAEQQKDANGCFWLRDFTKKVNKELPKFRQKQNTLTSLLHHLFQMKVQKRTFEGEESQLATLSSRKTFEEALTEIWKSIWDSERQSLTKPLLPPTIFSDSSFIPAIQRAASRTSKEWIATSVQAHIKKLNRTIEDGIEKQTQSAIGDELFADLVSVINHSAYEAWTDLL